MGITEKFKQYEKVFNENFIVRSDGNERGTNIPLYYVSYKKGLADFGYMGDGTINIALYANYLNLINEDRSGTELALRTMERLVVNKYISNWFYWRDDVMDADKSKFGLNSIMTPYSGTVEGINEDVCQSAVVSHDQIWNQLPFLGKCDFMRNALEFLIKHDGVLYDPLKSLMYHRWTYCNLKVPYKDRIKDRADNVKYKVKVKRGAYNPQLFYGFIKVWKDVYGGKYSCLKSLFYKMLYYFTVYGAEFIYYPILGNRVPIKNNSWHCMYVALGKKGWFGDRMVRQFNKSLKRFDAEPMHWHLIYEYNLSQVDADALGAYLEQYPQPKKDGIQFSPLIYMTLYKYYAKLRLFL